MGLATSQDEEFEDFSSRVDEVGELCMVVCFSLQEALCSRLTGHRAQVLFRQLPPCLLLQKHAVENACQ